MVYPFYIFPFNIYIQIENQKISKCVSIKRKLKAHFFPQLFWCLYKIFYGVYIQSVYAELVQKFRGHLLKWIEINIMGAWKLCIKIIFFARVCIWNNNLLAARHHRYHFFFIDLSVSFIFPLCKNINNVNNYNNNNILKIFLRL